MSDVEAAREEVQAFQKQVGTLREEIGRVIVGNREVVDGVITCVLAGSHALLEGVPRSWQDHAGAHAGPRRWRSNSRVFNSRPISCQPTSSVPSWSTIPRSAAAPSSSSAKVRCSPTSFWPTK